MKGMIFMKQSPEKLEKNMEYTFLNKNLLRNALTHTSYANENGIKKELSNERLEFLGDAIVDFVIGSKLFSMCPDKLEGELSKMRASIVCEQGLKEAADEIGLGEYILLGKGEEHTGGRNRASVVSDAFEAVIAAIYLDSNFETVQNWILKRLQHRINNAVSGKLNNDYKTLLQEFVQQYGSHVTYKLISETGPEHAKVFEVCVYKNNAPVSKGSGKSKKEAEQAAAKNALSALKSK